MTYLFLLLSFIIAFLQIEKLKERPVNKKAWSILSLTIVCTVISFVVEYNNKFDERYSHDTGIIDGGKILHKVFYIAQETFEKKITDGIFDINTVFPQLHNGIKLKIWFEDNSVKVTTDVRDTLGGLISSMTSNEWIVNPNLRLDRNFNDNSLEVIDNFGQVVFQIQEKGDHVFLRGVFFNSDGSFFVITSMKNVNGFSSFPFVAILKNYAAYRKLNTVQIDPIFKYPSNLHKGELINPE